MREELLGPKVENVAVAVVQGKNEDNETEYNVYLLNLREDIMEGIIITSKGYGQNANTGEKIQTSTLRHCIELMLPNEAAKIEPIVEEVFGLSNEYWVSFWVNDVMYDKKFVFLAETICEKNIKPIPILGAKGVIIM
ncbi:MAG: hypothetical protein LW701_01360 [Fluviicola sp.]|jgi:hypothetical protein|nr:hypothetical protein [Fluviicola sp.]